MVSKCMKRRSMLSVSGECRRKCSPTLLWPQDEMSPQTPVPLTLTLAGDAVLGDLGNRREEAWLGDRGFWGCFLWAVSCHNVLPHYRPRAMEQTTVD